MTQSLVIDDPQAKGVSRWSLVFGLVLAGVLGYFAFRGADWQKMYDTAMRGRVDYLIVALLVFGISFVARSLRWAIMLRTAAPFDFRDVFRATMTGYMANAFLPARAGEVIRSVMIARSGTVSTFYVFATTVTERLMDLITLSLLGLIAVALTPEMPHWLVAATRLTGLGTLIGAIVVWNLHKFEPALLRLIRSVRVESLRRRMTRGLQESVLGMSTLRNPRRAAAFAALTGLIWSLDVTAAVVTAHGVRLTLHPLQALILICALGVASAVPSPPGYVGVFQFVAVGVLPTFGMSREEALAYIVVFQLVTYAAVITYTGLAAFPLARVRGFAARV